MQGIKLLVAVLLASILTVGISFLLEKYIPFIHAHERISETIVAINFGIWFAVFGTIFMNK